jgi:hypothetical protein
MRIGQKVDEVIGDEVEVVGLRASPLMGLVTSMLDKVVSSVRGFGGDFVDAVFDPVQTIADHGMSGTLAEDFLGMANDTSRAGYVGPSGLKGPKV